MHFLIEKIKSLRIEWNQKSLNEADFYRLCRRFRISVTEMPLRTEGFYYRVSGRDFIAVNSRLPQPLKLLVLFHELGHFLFHTPESGATANFYGLGGSDRRENEADVFALCAVMPRQSIERYTIDELVEDSGLPPHRVAERLRILEKYGL